MTKTKKTKTAPPKTWGGKRKGAGRPRKSRLEAFAAAGPPPEDPLALPGWYLRILSIAAAGIQVDPDIDETTRCTEMKSLARHTRDLLPTERLYQAEERVIAWERWKTEAPKQTPDTHEMVDVTPSDQPDLYGDYRELRERQRKDR